MALVRFPPGRPVMTGRRFEESLFAELDALLARNECPEGWVDLDLGDNRLTCLIHQSRPFLAGLVEPERFSRVPLSDLVLRARNMEGAVCSVVRADLVRVLLMAVHFSNKPVLQATTRFVDLTHVLDVLAHDGNDAGLALERSGTRTLLFLQKGTPTRIYFGDARKDPGGGSIANRFLLYGFAPEAPVGKVEVFNKLNIPPDRDAGRTFTQLAEEAKPPPPMNVIVRIEDKVEMQRPFMPPYMIAGRDHTCELSLGDLSISRRHSKLSWSRGRFLVEDLGSANGTAVNGKRVERKVFNPGDKIGMGKYEVMLSPQHVTLDPKATMMIVPKDFDQTLYLTGDNQSAPLTSEVSIGKAFGVDLKARGMGVRAVHARVRIEGSGAYRLICLGNATVKLNNQKIKSAYLKAGDELYMGKTKFQLISIPSVDAF